jgi:hypothetical protein
MNSSGSSAFGQGSEPSDGHDLFFVSKIDHDRRDAGDVDQIALQHAERNPGRAARIDCVAAGFEDRKARGGREVMAGRYCVAGHGDGRTERGWCGHGESLARR